MAKKWAKFPHPDKRFAFDAAGLKKNWARLHRGDCEPFPKDAEVQSAWRHFHAGEFAAAVEAGERRAARASTPPSRHRSSTRPTSRNRTSAKIALLEEAAGWGDARRAAAPKDANAHYLYAFALGRYSQGISVAKALAQGLGGRVKEALLTAIKLEPKHADAHIAYGAYQAEVIDKVGGLVASMTYGAKKDSAVEHFEKAIKLNPDSAIARIEYANGLLTLFGKSRIADAEKLYRAAAAATPADAMERLDVARAQAELD